MNVVGERREETVRVVRMMLSIHNCVGCVFVAKFFNLCNGRAFCCYSNSVLWVRGYVFGLNKRLFVAVCLFGLDKNKRQAMLFFACLLCCRDDWIRTSDPYVPNVVRYQLRYIPL